MGARGSAPAATRRYMPGGEGEAAPGAGQLPPRPDALRGHMGFRPASSRHMPLKRRRWGKSGGVAGGLAQGLDRVAGQEEAARTAAVHTRVDRPGEEL